MMQQRNDVNLMPSLRNCRLRFLTWQIWDCKLRHWTSVMISASTRKKLRRTWPVSHNDRTSDPAAWRIWQTVSSGFFPPPLLSDLAQEQMADGCKQQVPLEREVITDLEVIHPQFALFLFEAGLD